jgi:hypothetical protein
MVSKIGSVSGAASNGSIPSGDLYGGGKGCGIGDEPGMPT